MRAKTKSLQKRDVVRKFAEKKGMSVTRARAYMRIGCQRILQTNNKRKVVEQMNAMEALVDRCDTSIVEVPGSASYAHHVQDHVEIIRLRCIVTLLQM